MVTYAKLGAHVAGHRKIEVLQSFPHKHFDFLSKQSQTDLPEIGKVPQDRLGNQERNHLLAYN